MLSVEGRLRAAAIVRNGLTPEALTHTEGDIAATALAAVLIGSRTWTTTHGELYLPLNRILRQLLPGADSMVCTRLETAMISADVFDSGDTCRSDRHDYVAGTTTNGVVVVNDEVRGVRLLVEALDGSSRQGLTEEPSVALDRVLETAGLRHLPESMRRTVMALAGVLQGDEAALYLLFSLLTAMAPNSGQA